MCKWANSFFRITLPFLLGKCCSIYCYSIHWNAMENVLLLTLCRFTKRIKSFTQKTKFCFQHYSFVKVHFGHFFQNIKSWANRCLLGNDIVGKYHGPSVYTWLYIFAVCSNWKLNMFYQLLTSNNNLLKSVDSITTLTLCLESWLYEYGNITNIRKYIFLRSNFKASHLYIAEVDAFLVLQQLFSMHHSKKIKPLPKNIESFGRNQLELTSKLRLKFKARFHVVFFRKFENFWLKFLNNL